MAPPPAGGRGLGDMAGLEVRLCNRRRTAVDSICPAPCGGTACLLAIAGVQWNSPWKHERVFPARPPDSIPSPQQEAARG